MWFSFRSIVKLSIVANCIENPHSDNETLKSRKIKNQRGGLWTTWETRLTDDMIYTFENPHTFPNDCCPCVFKLLGAPEEVLLQLFQYQDFNKRGMMTQEITDFYENIDPDYKYEFFSIIKPYNILGWVKKIFGNITPGYATLGGIERANGSKHCIVFAKDESHKIYLFDPQNNHYRKGKEEIEDYLQAKITLAETKELIAQKTRQYAKRQFTWSRGHMKSWEMIYSQNINDLFKKALNKIS